MLLPFSTNILSYCSLCLFLYPYLQASGYLRMKLYRYIGNAKVADGVWKHQFPFLDVKVQLFLGSFGNFLGGYGTEGSSTLAYLQGKDYFFVLQILCNTLAASKFSCATFSSFAF